MGIIMESYYSRHKEERTAYQKDYRKRNKKKIAETKQRYRQTEKGKSVSREGNKKYYKSEKGKQQRKNYIKRNLNKYRARSRIEMRVHRGTLQRPNICSLCKKECRPEAHHKDYNKPLDIIWVCKGCHLIIG